MWKLNLLKAERQNNNNKQITKKQNKTKQKPLILIGKPQRPARSRRTSKNVSASHCQPSCLQSGERQSGREGKGILRRGTAKRFPSATVSSEGVEGECAWGQKGNDRKKTAMEGWVSTKTTDSCASEFQLQWHWRAGQCGMWVSVSGDSTWGSASYRGESSPLFVVDSLHMENGVSKLSWAVCVYWVTQNQCWEDNSRDVEDE